MKKSIENINMMKGYFDYHNTSFEIVIKKYLDVCNKIEEYAKKKF